MGLRTPGSDDNLSYASQATWLAGGDPKLPSAESPKAVFWKGSDAVKALPRTGGGDPQNGGRYGYSEFMQLIFRLAAALVDVIYSSIHLFS